MRMWKTLWSFLTKKPNLKKNRIAYESLNENLAKCLEEHLSRAVETTDTTSFTGDTQGVDKRHGRTTKTDIGHYKFKFKNLVLGGSGANGVAYCGVAIALEEHGILKNIQRFAGTSAGAIVAALLSIGLSSNAVKEIMKGLPRAETIKKLLGEVLESKTGNPDINFRKIFEEYNKELCIVVPNATGRSDKYYHMNTSPDLPIRDAVCMSLSFPGQLQSFDDAGFGGKSLKADEEAFCYYPINCFDELWLRSIDSNMQEMIYQDPYTIQDRYLETMGCVVYSQNKYHSLRDQIEKKYNVPRRPLPDTKLSSEWKVQQRRTDIGRKFFLQCIKHHTEFLKIFYEGSGNKKEFSLDEFKQILRKGWNDDEKSEREKKVPCHCARTYAKTIYGDKVDEEMIFKSIEKSNEEKVTRPEVLSSAQEIGSILFQKYKDFGSNQKEIDEIKSFVSSVVTGYRPEVNYNFFKDDDVARTVGINTWYIDALDFAMKTDDINFLMDQGKYSTEEFLTRFVLDHNSTKYKDLKSSDGPSLTQQDEEAIIGG